MSSQWVNKFAIMRDLSLAQGCLPVDVAGTVGAGEKPPSTTLKEDTEEEFYHQWVGGEGDFAAPDLGLIKDMLEMVRNHDSPTNENEDPENILQIRKLNPLCAEFKPKAAISDDIPVSDKKKLKKKKPRNAAVQSLLQNIEEITTTHNKLLKPADFSFKHKPETAENVFTWFQQPVKKTPSPPKKNAPILDFHPMAMFKKKNIIEPAAKPVKEVKKTYNLNKYVPSKNAEEYYKKFVECSEMHRMVEEDVWTKVERQMKEIDERRKAEAELLSLSLALCKEEAAGGATAGTDDQKEQDPTLQKLNFVLLPQHRHQMSSPCIVCEIQHGRDKHPQPTRHTNTPNDVDDPWWNWREPDTGKQVDDNWRNQIVADETQSDNHYDGTQHSWRANNNTVLDSWRSQKETTLKDKDKNKTESINMAETLNNTDNDTQFITTIEDENLDKDENKTESIATTETFNDKNDNETQFIATIVDDNLEILKEQNTIVNDNSWKEEFESWRSPLEDEDEIDAWRYEILGVDDDDDDVDKTDAVDDNKTVDKTEAVDDNKTVDKTEAVDDNKTVDKTEAVDDNKTVDKTEAADDNKTVDKTETVDDNKTVDKTETVDDNKTVDKTTTTVDDKTKTVYKTKTVNNIQHTEDESWQNEGRIDEVINNLEKWRSILLDNDSKNKTDDVPIKSAFQTRMSYLKYKKNLIFDCHRPLEAMEILSDSE